MGIEKGHSLSLTRYWAASFLALLVASNRLWLPSDWTSTEEYPSIAMSAASESFANLFAIIALPIFTSCCLTIIGFDADSKLHHRLRVVGWSVLVLTLGTGFAADQHRLQPWAYQVLLYGLIGICLPRRGALPFLRAITVSIYVFSSIGKLDFQFVHTVGQNFLNTAWSFVGVDVSAWDESIRNALVLGFPAAELMVGVLCSVPKTRRWGGGMAIVMHASLIALLSPWGMNHSPGVLVWNAALAGQAYLLFVRTEAITPAVTDEAPSNHHERSSARRYGLAGLLTLVVISLPLTERRGRENQQRWHWDHWLSWALYSPHNSRFYWEVRPHDIDSLAPSIREALGEDPDGDGWRTLDLDQFSLNVRGVPVLPQARYQLQLAMAITEQQGWNRAVRGVIRSASDRTTGVREEQWLVNFKEMQEASKQYWLGPAAKEPVAPR